MKKYIIGLGNLEKKYENNRHNAGFLFVEKLAEKFNLNWKEEKKLKSLTVTLTPTLSTQQREGDVASRLFLPQTYMNESGQAVSAILNFYKIKPEEIVVVHDDLDFPVGKIKEKFGGGHGGHNGLRSIIEHIGHDFWRIRIGIGHPGHKDLVSDYVLNDFTKEELEIVLNLFDEFIKF